MENKAAHIIKEKFAPEALFTKKELAEALQHYGLAENDNALRQIIYTLSQKRVIQSPKRGIYTTRIKALYKPQVDNYMLRVRRLFTTQYPDIHYCIWSGRWLHEFMVHQPFSSFYLFESEADMLGTVFYLFSDNNLKAFLRPDSTIMENYVSQARTPLIIEKLPARPPVVKQGNNILPTLEKMLVDVFINKSLFYYYQGAELENIFRFAYQSYFINFSSLLSYAASRGQKQNIIAFLKNKTEINPILLS